MGDFVVKFLFSNWLFLPLVNHKDILKNIDIYKDILQNIDINICLLYNSDATDERSSVDLGGLRLLNKQKDQSDRQNVR